MKPLVAIHCLVYNHEAYLRDCLNGFVMQETNFPFCAVVHDDASTDSSASIIREYAEKYPDIIKPIYEKENQYSKHDGSHRRIMNETINAMGAKYVAMCEGDDYWTDEHKLQRQVDYMEAHPDCTCYAHNSICLNTQTSEIRLFNKKLLKTQDYTLETFITKDWFTPTQSLLYRRSDYHAFEDMPGFLHGDYSLLVNILIKPNTYLHYENSIMSVYRDGGWASTYYKELDLFDDFISLLSYYKGKSNHRCDAIFDKQLNRQLLCKEAYVSYVENVKNSKSLHVRIWHWISRIIVKVANMYVKCIYVSKVVKMDSIPNIEKLD